MANNYSSFLWAKTFKVSHLGRNSMMFFGVLFLILFSTLSVVGQANVTPSYEWLDKRDLATVNFGISGINSEDIVVSIATDPAGNVYTLSFGNGVDKRDSNGNLIKQGFIPSGMLQNPLDIAIDKEGFIYIADYFAGGTTFADNGKIWVFDPTGILLTTRTVLTSFFRPMGIDVDDQNIYIAEYNDGNQGPEKNKYSRLEVVNKFNSSQRFSIDDINGETFPKVPYRIAVDSQKRIFVSQAGNNNPQVLVYDYNLQNPMPLPNITSAGSVVVDKFDFIHVLEYAGRVDFEQFINYENVGVSEGLAIAKNIRDGIKNNEFTIKIFNQNKVLVKTIVDNAANDFNIEFPLDMTFDTCGKMYLDNSQIFGSDTFLGYIPSKLEFDLEIYNRTPSFDLEIPVVEFCPGDQTETLTAGSLILPDYRNLANFTDNCDKDLTLIQSPAVGDIITQTTTVTITAKDDAGNSSSCEFQVIIGTSTDTEPPTITCPDPISKTADPGKCGAVVTFANATATDNSGETPTITRVDNTGLNSGSLFPVGSTTISFRATDATGNFSECSFTITVADNEKPTISCPADISETVAFGETGKIITYTAPAFDDNCSGAILKQTDGFASGSEFSLGTTTNTFVVTDAKGNTATCSFDVTITESSDTEKPVITCPAPISKNVDSGQCGAIITFADATATDNSGDSPTITREDNTGLNSGDLFPVGQTTISFRATDGAGNFNECSFTITVTDGEKPTISCPADISETVAIGETGKIVTFSAPVFDDNCAGATMTQTDGFASGSRFPLGTTTNTFVVTDGSGNTETCSFDVTITESSDTEKPVINCPVSISQNTDSGECGAVVTFANATATDNSGSVSVSLISSLSSGSEFSIGTSTVTFQAKDAAGNTADCSFTITITDNEDPTISCPADISETVAIGETGKIINYTAPIFDDNCSGSTINQTAGFASGSEFPVGTTTNTFVVTDGSGNTSTCAFDVVLTEENPSNTAPISRDDIHSTLQDVTLTVPASSGVLSNDSDEEGDVLTAVLVTDVSSGTLTLNSDGSFIYVPNSGFSGNDFFTYTANDGSLNSVASTARIEVVAVSGNTVTCKESVSLELDENGTVSLNPEDLFTTRPADLEFSISQVIFTCEDLGENTITLSYSNSDVQGSCEVIIIVKDVTAPIIRVKDISVALNQFGSANITPEMVDNGSTDNCEDLSFSLSKLNFGCKELGENTVTFTATDASGNSTSMTATVTITGSCEIQPTPEVEYIFIYPNPTTGPFQFATPTGVTIQRVEVFDNRGRMIMYKEYSAAELQYAMDLSGVQDAVYILKLFTSDGTSIVRVIIN